MTYWKIFSLIAFGASILGLFITFATLINGRLTRRAIIKVIKETNEATQESIRYTQELIRQTQELIRQTQELIKKSSQQTQELIKKSSQQTQELIKSLHQDTLKILEKLVETIERSNKKES